MSTGTPELNKALAAVQAKLPKIEKGQEGKVEGVSKAGKHYSYTYKYADLADLSAVVLPLLGQHGLAFISLPGLSAEGKFGLSYALLHESGEQRDGFYPITHGTAQENGSSITYARRYCLGAVTGIAPAEDDDGAAASQARGGGEDDWRNQPPVNRPRSASNGHGDWADQAEQRALALKDREAARGLWHEVTEAAKAGRISEKQRDDLHDLITAQIEDLNRQQAPPVATATAPEGDPWLAKIEEITSEEDAAKVREELDAAHRGGLVDSRRHKALGVAIRTRLSSLKVTA